MRWLPIALLLAGCATSAPQVSRESVCGEVALKASQAYGLDLPEGKKVYADCLARYTP